MSKISENVNVPTADAARRSKKPPIHASHVTTQSFLRPSVALACELFPNRKIDLNLSSFCRLNPMPRPVMSRAKVYNRAFYVPFRTVYADFTSFVSSSPVPMIEAPLAVPGNTPFITNYQLVELLQTEATYQDAAGAPFDFYVVNSQSTNVRNGAFVFSDQGIFMYKILRSLGYNPVFDMSDSQSDSYSLLPLYAYIKVILDWYYPSAYAYSDIFAYFESLFTAHGQDHNVVDIDRLNQFFTEVAYCSYDADYFVSCWDKPVGPSSTQFEAFVRINDVTNSSNAASTVTNNDLQGLDRTPFIQNKQTTSPTTPRPTQYIIDALRSLTDYTKRHQLVGVRAVDRYLAEFGINLQSELLKRSLYLGYNDFELTFYDVMSHADTDEASLGDYAGRSFSNGSKHFAYQADEYGMFIIINSVIPLVSNYQGTNRHVFHLNPLDFYRGDFDHLGVQAIAKSEVFVPKDGRYFTDAGLREQIFGYIPRYAEYHVIPDLVTGRFEAKTQNAELLGFVLGRDIASLVPHTVANFKHGLDYVLATDYKTYNRIFYNVNTAEQIIMSHDFNVQFEDSSRPLWESYDFEDVFNSVKENINGSTVN